MENDNKLRLLYIATQHAFAKWCGIENYEERICEGAFMDELVLNILLGDA